MNRTEKRTVSQEKLELIIKRIVEVAQPEKIILFGSAAREEMGPNSDVDLLVIKAGAHRLDLAGKIYCNLYGVGEPVDVVVVTPRRCGALWQESCSCYCSGFEGRQSSLCRLSGFLMGTFG